MNAKKFSTAGIVLVSTVLIALGGFWRPATAKSEGYRLEEDQTIGLGGQGLHVTNIPRDVTHVYLDTAGTHLPSRFSHKIDLQSRVPAMEVRFLDAKGGKVERINALVYVYFDIGRAERDLWFKSGMQEIAIWFANDQTGSWELCHTYFVHQSGGDGTVGRLTCLAPGSGYYMLGQDDFSKYVPKPQTVGAAKVASAAKLTLSPTLQIPSEEWNWYENEDYGYRIAHPKTWTHIVEWDEIWNEQTYEYLVIHRDRSFSDTAEVIVDIWNVSKIEGVDLIDWLNQSEGITLGESNEYNATISGLDAVFQFQPATGMSGDLAQLIFTNGKFVFRIFFTSGAIPTEETDIQVFLDSMESFTLLSGSSGPLILPTGWEK